MLLRTFAFVLVAALSACSSLGNLPLVRAGSAANAPSPSSGYASLYSFPGGKHGANPMYGLTLFDGSLYGVETGPNGSFCGLVYRMSTSGANRTVYQFKCGADGQYPESSLVVLNGALYGTTAEGGASDNGTVFTINKSGQERIIYSFRAHHDASHPEGNLVAIKGKIYGTSSLDSLNGYGTVFSVTPAGKERVLYDFKNSTQDGNGPVGLVAANNMLYGATSGGGADNYGTVFTLGTSGKHERMLHTFTGPPHDGEYPTAPPTLWNGVLYGATYSGGPGGSGDDDGTIYELTSAGKEKLFYSFSGADGWNPDAALILYGNALYGTTLQGGAAGYGTVFEVTASGSETVLHSFDTTRYDGTFPESPLAVVGTNFYGTTESGGLSYLGTFYRVSP